LFEEKIEVEDFSSYTSKLIEFNSSVWKEKKENGLSLRDSICVEVPKELKIFEKELKLMHNIIDTTER
jgi:valyl-tRNA synthetase